MTAELERIFNQYGSVIRVARSNETPYTEKAFVQPMRKDEKEYPFTVTGLGGVDDRHWLCLTRSALQEGDRVWLQEKCFVAVNCVEVRWTEQLSHWRSVLRPEREGTL